MYWKHLAFITVVMFTALSCKDNVAGPSGPAIVPSITNGSFEDGPAFNLYMTLDSGSVTVPGWRVTNGQIDVVSYWQSYSGARSIDLDGSPGVGGIGQTVRTTPGAVYRIRFALAGNPEGPPSIKTMQISAGGHSTQFTFDVTGKTTNAMGWTVQTWSFTASDTTTTIVFSSLDPAASRYGPALDSVSVSLAQ